MDTRLTFLLLCVFVMVINLDLDASVRVGVDLTVFMVLELMFELPGRYIGHHKQLLDMLHGGVILGSILYAVVR